MKIDIYDLTKITLNNKDFIYDIFYNKDKVIIIGNNLITEKIEYENIICKCSNFLIVKSNFTAQYNGDGFFVIEYQVVDNNYSEK